MLLMSIYLALSVCYVCTGTQGGQKSILDPLKLELRVAVSWSVWVLQTKKVLLIAEPPLQTLFTHSGGFCYCCFGFFLPQLAE